MRGSLGDDKAENDVIDAAVYVRAAFDRKRGLKALLFGAGGMSTIP